MRTLNFDSDTHSSLLKEISSNAAQSDRWVHFVETYGPYFYRWARQWGLDHHETEDMIQETLLIVFRKIGEFHRVRSGSLRAWLKTISHNCWIEMARRKVRQQAEQEDSKGSEVFLDSDSRKQLTAFFETMAHREIIDIAISQVRQRVRDETWICFREMQLLDRPAVEVAEKLGMTPGAVTMAVHRFRSMLAREVRRLDPENS